MAANIQEKIPFGVVINLVTGAIASDPNDVDLPFNAFALNTSPSAS
jgi:hypothetical protein